MVISLISCTSSKKPYKCEAREQYSESLRFRLAYSIAKRISDKVLILSAKYGLIAEDTLIEPYNETLKDKNVYERRRWAEQVLFQLKEKADIEKDEFIVLAGEVYHQYLTPYLSKQWLPLKGKALGEWIPELNKLIQIENEKDLCIALHMVFNALPRYDWTMINDIPYKNGIYIMIEMGQYFQGMDRIARVGTHRGQNRLLTRLKNHFTSNNSNRSIFRKNIGRVLLNKAEDPYIKVWELDSTRTEDKIRNSGLIDKVKEAEIEEKISNYLKKNISFVCFPVETKEERLRLEEGIISLLNNAPSFVPSENWIGLSSPIKDISESGLWNKQGLNGTPLSEIEFEKIKYMVRFGCTTNKYTAINEKKSTFRQTQQLNADINDNKKTVDDVRKYIDSIFTEAKMQDKTFTELVSGQIHKQLGMKSRMPQVCRIMYEKMKPGDKVLNTTPSGKSSTIRIRYYLK